MDVKIKLNIKACCLFEHMTGKSFFRCSTPDDILHILYAMYVVSNDSTITYDLFTSMLENKKLAKAFIGEYNSICKYLEQMNLNEQISSYNQGKEPEEGAETTITQLATSLIVQHHMDANYVMYKMEIWEIIPYFQVADNMRKMELIDKRFWTYMQIMPHIDTKKVKTPEKLFQFDFEKAENNDKIKKDLEEKTQAIKQFFEAQRKAKELREKQKEEQNNG